MDVLFLKEELGVMLETFRENIESHIGAQEKVIMKATNEHWKQTETKLVDSQHKRNRNIVKEIINCCNTFKEETK